MHTAIPGNDTPRTLRHLVQGHPLPLPHVAALGVAILDQLDAMTEHDSFLRCLAPDDIQVEGELQQPQVRIVATTCEAGRANYMSPEVREGQPPGMHSAMWQAGALLFELLSGRPPWGASHPAEQGGMIRSLTDARPDITDDLACTIYRMLDPDPDLRLQSLPEVRAAISSLLGAATGHGSPVDGVRVKASTGTPAPPSVPASWTMTPFIGRTAEMAEIRRVLAATPCRVLTVLGPGGIGKSRLAFHAAQDLSSDFADGAFVVPLGTVHSPAFVALAIANALDVTLYGKEDPTDQLAAFLSQKRLLLVLDDFDRLTEGACVLTRLLTHACGPRFLVTSRTRLNLEEEALLHLEGLRVSDDLRDPGAGGDDAIQLFLEHVRRLGAGAHVTKADMPDVVRICRMLDGVPLAIEQAASWVRTLTCAAIAGEIGRDIDFLSTTTRDASRQHRSMRAVFDRSWRLLDDAHRRVLARVSVFAGGFRRDAAVAVAGLDLSMLAQMVDRSLIQRAGPHRYQMHNLLRSFLREKLAGLEAEPARTLAAHAGWYADFLSAEEKGIRAGDPETLARVDAESDNIAAAWEWGVRTGEPSLLEGLLDPLCLLISLRAWYHAGDRLCGDAARRLNALPSSEGLARLRARLMSWQGSFQFRLGERAGTRSLLEQSRRIQADLRADRDLAFTLRHLALVATSQGDRAEAMALLDEALALCKSTSDRGMEAYVLGDMGIMAQEAGDYAAAEDHYVHSLRLHRNEGVVAGLMSSLNTLGTLCRSRGDLARARAYFEESRDTSRRIGNRRAEMVAITSLCNLALDNGELDEALKRAREALEIARDLGHQDLMAVCLCILGNVHIDLRHGDEARHALEESLAIRTVLGAHHEAAVSRACLADALCITNEFDRASALYRESLQVFEHDQNRWGMVTCLRGLCEALVSKGDLPAARDAAVRALAVLKGSGDRRHAQQVLGSWVRLLLAQGHHRRAAELWGSLAAHLPAARLSADSERVLRILHAELSARELSDALAAGGLRSPEGLIDELADEQGRG
ncbi:tetratricopeptide repeat protein [Candidatus Fermentibacteria bacterium]|nr:tetratricopeptide repeat protein [Candidatus Fermentibacteria bacterium]